jgi:hypothetical protein
MFDELTDCGKQACQHPDATLPHQKSPSLILHSNRIITKTQKLYPKLEIVIYGISGLFKILPTRGICNLRGLARVGYYLKWVILNNPRMPYNVLSNIPKIFR